MPNSGGGGSSKSMGGGYAGGGSGWQVNRVEGAGAIATSEHDTSGKVAYGEPEASNSIEQWLSLVKR
jgi:surface antigen